MRFISGIYCLLFCIVLFTSCRKESSIPESNSGMQFYYDSGTEKIHGSKGLKNGSLAYVGESLGDGYIFVVDASGKELWRKRAGGTGLDKFHSLCELKDGSIVAVGFTHSAEYGVTTTSADGFAVKFSTTGAVVWEKAYGGENQEKFYDCIEDIAGDLVFVGSHLAFNSRSFIVKADASGTWLWYRTFQVGDYHSYAVGITLSSTGAYVIGGLNSSSVVTSQTRDYQTYLLSLEPTGGTLLFGTIYSDYVRGADFDNLFPFKMTLLTESDGYLIGSFYETPGPIGAVQLIKTNLNGVLVKERKIPDTGNLRFTSMIRGSDGAIFVCGAYSEAPMLAYYGFTSSRAALMKLDADWNVVWISETGGEDLFQCSYAVVEGNKEYRIAALSENRQKGTGKLMFYRVDANGKLIQTHD